MNKIEKLNSVIAVRLTNSFGNMWSCYLFMILGLLPLLAIFTPYQDKFLYWFNWIQMWSLPLILVGTNILGKNAEDRAQADHKKLEQSYHEQLIIYKQVVKSLKRQEEIMQEMIKQDEILKNQDAVLEEQTDLLKKELQLLEKQKA